MTGNDERPARRGKPHATFNLAPRAQAALAQARDRTGDNLTDTINRALPVYNLVLDLVERCGGHLKVVNEDGSTENVHLT